MSEVLVARRISTRTYPPNAEITQTRENIKIVSAKDPNDNLVYAGPMIYNVSDNGMNITTRGDCYWRSPNLTVGRRTDINFNGNVVTSSSFAGIENVEVKQGKGTLEYRFDAKTSWDGRMITARMIFIFSYTGYVTAKWEI